MINLLKVLGIFIILVSFYFTSKKTSPCDNVSKISIKSIVQFSLGDGKLQTETKLTGLYSFENFLICEIPINFYQTITEDSATFKIVHCYFVYKKDAQYGIIYDDYRNRNNRKKANVDSMLTQEAYKGINLFVSKTLQLLSTRKDPTSGILEETYTGKPPYGTDTIFYTLDPKLNHITYSLSKEMDSLRQAKLIKARIISYSGVKDSSLLSNRRELEFEIIKNDSVDNCTKILALIEQFKKETF
jgi:hypothetical protein